MYKIPLFAFFIFSVSILSSQTNVKIAADISYPFNQETDTLRTFVIFYQNPEACINKLIEVWGVPEKRWAGTIKWNNVTIPNIGNHLNIVLYDGIDRIEEKSGRYSFFLSKRSKIRKLKSLKKNETRRTEIEIYEDIIKSETGNPAATFFPEGTLVDLWWTSTSLARSKHHSSGALMMVVR